MRQSANHYRPTLELLERRDLPTTAVLSGGHLYIRGTAGRDVITVSQSHGQITVSGTLITVGRTRVSHVSASRVHDIVVYGYGGGDLINLRPSAATAVTKYATIYSGRGHNTIFGGNGGNTIYAGGHDVVNGGAGVDHLAARSSADVLNGGGGLDYFYRPFTASAPVVAGGRVSDVKQGQSPSCQADAALAAAVKEGYNFAGHIRYLGHSTYDVSLYGGRVHEHVVFNGWYTEDDPVPAVAGEFWTILEYRARLMHLGINPNVNHTMAQWNALDRSTHGRLYAVGDALTTFTGRTTMFTVMTRNSAQTLHSELARGDFLVVSTPPGSGFSADGIARDHAYAVMAVYYQSGTWKVRLYNPWAFDSAGERTLDAAAGTRPRNDGFITLTWARFVSMRNFQGVTRAAAPAAYTAYFRRLGGTRE
jgi:Ca2+-binding RTX toxin-like protein